MRSIASILVFLAIMTQIVSNGAGNEYIYIKDVTMHLKGDNATFELNYTLETFTRFYVLALGCKYLERELLSFLGNYGDVRLIKADMNSASLLVCGAGKYDRGYYLFDSRPLGTKNQPLKESIDRFSVVYPQGRTRTFYNVTSTQSVSFLKEPLSNISLRSLKAD
jgi:hypothetical protein